ncbi:MULTISPECIES: hypothetical protein [unclassified Agarivorans]|nr:MULTISPECIES: hypothetical protein [unclassified Agarivorans]MDO6684196.1 hypothetical protein [Agarivorans sp. 3_MG-2023]MDO6714070.1 hypothetical protein [Agarivorans sp. 2_MG-2023]MDO6762686.1 hypothetical protein [Agarivorans sp. 1_MG-2023]GDY24778.1 hypothetical protein AHAT_06680 [Agarivorans sp. Toyoura001]
MKKLPMLVAIIGLALSLPSIADCVHGGNVYPEGATIGSYKCVNGSWVGQ